MEVIIIKALVCWGKSKARNCNIDMIEELSKEIKKCKIGISKLDLLQLKLKECIKSNNINYVLNLDMDYINGFYLGNLIDEMWETDYKSEAVYDTLKKTVCKLQPSSCTLLYEVKKDAFKKLDMEMKNKIIRYNKDLAIIKKLKNYYYKNKSYKDYIDGEMYFKFGRDKYNDLIAMHFNIDSLIIKNIETVLVFSGEGESPYKNHTMLHLKYEKYPSTYGMDIRKVKKGAQVHICDFISNNPRRGHATFILKNLEDLICKVNMRIRNIKKEYEEQCYEKEEIVAINGVVCPGNLISYKDLVEFYNKNGLHTIGRTYPDGSYAKDKVIYKEF